MYRIFSLCYIARGRCDLNNKIQPVEYQNMKKYCYIIILLFSFFGELQAQTLYVTDNFEIMLRTEPAADKKIIKALPSGTKLKVITRDAGNKHSEVETEDGEIGYVLTRFLSGEPAAKDQLVVLQEQLSSLKNAPDQLTGELLQTKEKNSQLSERIIQIDEENQRLLTELAELKEASSDVINIMQDKKTTEEETKKLIMQVEDMRLQIAALKDHSDKKWAMVGGGLIIGGMFLGMILASGRRRRSGWGNY